jgi:large subunit ribosomal protein L25
MAEIVLNVEVRERTGTGGARSSRRAEKVPGILYGGPRGPVPIAVGLNEFKKALYTGKLLGHLVTLKHGKESQPVIAKDVQFHPVTDRPVHFDLYRVEEGQQIKINIPVHFTNHEASPGIKRGGVLNAVRHDIEVWADAGHIPEEIVVDLSGLEIGDQVRISGVTLPQGVRPTVTDRDFVVATVTGRMAEVEEVTPEAAAAAAAPEAEAPEAEGGGQAEE